METRNDARESAAARESEIDDEDGGEKNVGVVERARGERDGRGRDDGEGRRARVGCEF